MNKKFYVYYLISTNDNNIFYVGKGSGNRMHQHVKIATNNRKNKSSNPKLYNKIDFLLKNGHEIIPEIIFESYNEKECLDYEVEKIKEIGLDNLCNITVGGEGSSGRPCSIETRIKLSNINKGKISKRKGIKLTEDAKLKISNTMKGRISSFKGKSLSEESKLKMSISHKDKKFTDEHRDNISKSLLGKKKTEEHITKMRNSFNITIQNKKNVSTM